MRANGLSVKTHVQAASAEESLRLEAVESFFTMLNGMDYHKDNSKRSKIDRLFDSFNSDGNDVLDTTELMIGLLDRGRMHSKQAQAFIAHMVHLVFAQTTEVRQCTMHD